MIAVFGSGFGIYGHLPALVESGHPVCIPSRYRPVVEERTELAAYRSEVRFIDDEETLLSTSELAVLARRPADNAALARRVIAKRFPLRVVIEKPLAPTPSDALSLERELRTARMRYATPYLLQYCDWARNCRLEVAAGRAVEIELNWHFSSKQPQDSWKSISQEGGGALSYYFIHVIALGEFLLGDYQVVECLSVNGEPGSGLKMVAVNGSVRFSATFCTGPGASMFALNLNGIPAFTADTPFGANPRRGFRDPRIESLKRFYTDEVFTLAAQQPDESRNSRTLTVWADLAKRMNSEYVSLRNVAR